MSNLKPSGPQRIVNGWWLTYSPTQGRVSYELEARDDDQGFRTFYQRFDSHSAALAYAQKNPPPQKESPDARLSSNPDQPAI